MTRNIFVNVALQSDGSGSYNIIRHGTAQHDINHITCDFKSSTSYLQIFDKIRSKIGYERIKAISFVSSIFPFPTYAEYYQFRQKCYKLCQANGIFYYSPRPSFIDSFMMLSKTSTMVNEGEIVTTFKVDFGNINAASYIREKNYFRCIQMHGPSKFLPTLQWKNEFMGDIKPEKVVFLSSWISNPSNEMKQMFKNHKTFFITPEIFENAIVEMAQHTMGEKISQYYIQEIFGVTGIVHDDEKNYIKIEAGDSLPLERSVIVDVHPCKALTYSVYYLPSKPTTFFKQIKLSSFECKKVKATIKIDVNGFYDFSVVPCIGKEKLVERMSKIDITDEPSEFSKARIIFDKQNFAVFVGDDKKMEVVVKDVDGYEKIPIYIAFMDDPKPKVGNIAKEFYSENPKAVVFDLIKLCSISTDDVMSPKWGFKLEKEDNALIVTVDTVDGEKKSTVDFLFAFILKHGLKMVKNKIERKMEELEIGFNGFVPNEILKKNFENAAALLYLKIIFV